MTRMDELKRALSVNAAVYEAVRTYIRPGVSERDIYELTKAVVDKMLYDVPHDFIGDFVGGKRCGHIGGDPTEYRLSAGDGLILDLSVRCGNTWSDTCRTFFLGEPSDEVQKAYSAVLTLQAFGVSMVHPGIRAEEIKTKSEQLLASLGYGGRMPHHMGHAIGSAPFMPPVFDTGCADTVAVGDFFTLEPGIYIPNAWGLRVENDYLLHSDGAELLFDYPTELSYFTIGE